MALNASSFWLADMKTYTSEHSIETLTWKLIQCVVSEEEAGSVCWFNNHASAERVQQQAEL